MDELCKIALLVIVPAMLGITARQWQISTRQEGLRRELKEIKDTIGRDSNSGMRGVSHKRKGQIATLAQHIDMLREKAGMRPIDLSEAFRKDDK